MSGGTKEALCVTLEERCSTKRTVNFMQSIGISLFIILSPDVYLSFIEEFYIWKWFWDRIYRPCIHRELCPAERKCIKVYCAAKTMIRLDIKRLRMPLKPAVMEVRQRTYILEIKRVPHTHNWIVTRCILRWCFFSYFPSREKTQLLHCATQYSIYHILHISAREKTQCCVGAYGIMINML